MKKILINTILLVLLNGCDGCDRKYQESKNNILNAKYIVDIHDPVNIELDDFIIDIDTIRLEVTNESLIKNILNIQIMDGRLYVLSNDYQIVFIFDLNGKYISQINDKGQGPKEYIKIGSLRTDPINKRIVLSDSFSRRIFIYDRDGKQINVIPLDFSPVFVAPYKNGYINNCTGLSENYYNNPKMDNFHINFLDSTGKFINSDLKKENKNAIAIESRFCICLLNDGDILYQPALSNIIYKIHDYEIIPHYTFNNLSNKFKLLTDKETRDFEHNFEAHFNTIKEKENNGYLLTWGDVLDMNDYVVFLFRGWDNCRYLFYNKMTLKSYLIDPLFLKGDKNIISFFLNFLIAFDENRIYISQPMDYIIYYKQKKVFENMKNMKDKKVSEYLDNTDDDANPLLISFKIKFPE